jgi:hypothetical protein
MTAAQPTLRVDLARGTATVEIRPIIEQARDAEQSLWQRQTAVRALLKALRAANWKAGERTPFLDVDEEAALLDMALEQESGAETCREEIEIALRSASLLLGQGHDQP